MKFPMFLVVLLMPLLVSGEKMEYKFSDEELSDTAFEKNMLIEDVDTFSPHFFLHQANSFDDIMHEYRRAHGLNQDFETPAFLEGADVAKVLAESASTVSSSAESDEESAEVSSEEESESESESSSEEEDKDGKKKVVKRKYKNLRHCSKSKVCCLAAGLSKGQLMNKCRGTQKKVSIHKCGCHNPATYKKHHKQKAAEKKAAKKPTLKEAVKQAAQKVRSANRTDQVNQFGNKAASQSKDHAKGLLKNVTDHWKKKFDDAKKALTNGAKVPKTCDGIKAKVLGLLKKAKFDEKALAMVNKKLKIKLKSPVAMTLTSKISNSTCLPITINVEFDSNKQTIKAGPAAIYFTGLKGSGTIGKPNANGTLTYEVKVQWETAKMVLLGKTFKFDDDAEMTVGSNVVSLPLPQMRLGKMKLTGLTVTMTKDPKSIAFTATSNWPFGMSFEGEFPAEGKPTVSATATIKNFRIGSSTFGMKFQGLEVGADYDAGDIKVSVMYKKGSVSVFGKKTNAPKLAGPMEFEPNGVKIPLAELNLGVVKLGKTTISVTRKPLQFSAQGSITKPLPIDFDCIFPLSGGKPSIKLSTTIKTLRVGGDAFGVHATGLSLAGEYAAGKLKVEVRAEKFTAKILGAKIQLSNAKLVVQKGESFEISVSKIKVGGLTLPGGRLFISGGKIEFETSITVRGTTLNFVATYNRTTADIDCSLKSKGLKMSVKVGFGSFKAGQLDMYIRQLGIQYNRNTKRVAFTAQTALHVNLLSFKVKFDPIDMFLSKDLIKIDCHVKDVVIFGAKPVVTANISWTPATGADASLNVKMTNQDVAKIFTGFMNANTMVLIKACMVVSGPLAGLCAHFVKPGIGFLVTAFANVIKSMPGQIQLNLNKKGVHVFVEVAVGKGLAKVFAFAKLKKVADALSKLVTQVGIEWDIVKKTMPAYSFKIKMSKGYLWFMRSVWFCKACPRFGLAFVEIGMKMITIPLTKATFYGTAAFEIFKIFNPMKYDTWVLKLSGYLSQTTTGSVMFGLSLEVIKPVMGAFGIPGFNLHYIKLAVEVDPSSAILLKSIEVSLTADLGPITGVTIAGKLDIADVTQNYLYFAVDKTSLSKIVGGVIGKRLTSWPSFLDFKLDKTSMYIAFANVVVNLGGGKSIALKGPGFGCKTGISFLGFQVVIDMGVYLKNMVIPVLFINKFKLDSRPIRNKIRGLIDAVTGAVTRVLNWKPLKVALSFMGKGLMMLFPITFIELTGLQVDPSNPLKIRLPDISIGFPFGTITIPGFGVQEGLKMFPKLFMAALRAFGNVWKWIKTLGLKLFAGLKALAKFVFKAVSKLVGAAVKFLAMGVKHLGKLLGKLGGALVGAAKAVGKFIGNCAKAVGAAFKKGFKAVGKFLKGAGKVFGKVAGAIVNVFKNPVQSLKAVGKFFAKVVNWNGLVNGAKVALKAVGKVAKAAFKAASKFVKNVAAAAGRAARAAARAASRAARAAARAVSQAASRAARAIKDGAVRAARAAARAAKAAYNYAKKAAQRAARWAKKKAAAAARAVGRFARRTARAARRFFRRFGRRRRALLSVEDEVGNAKKPALVQEEEDRHGKPLDYKFQPGERFTMTYMVKRLHQTFQQMDTNKDGHITKTELENLDYLGGTKSCHTLRWRVSRRNRNVCGVSLHGKCRSYSHDKATQMCEKIGARLCTANEIRQGVVHNRARCPNRHIWTSNYKGCKDGEFKVARNRRGTICRKTYSRRVAQPRSHRKRGFLFTELSVPRACNSDAGCTEGTSCQQGICAHADGDYQMEMAGNKYWEARRQARNTAPVSEEEDADEAFEQLEPLSQIQLENTCDGGCAEGTKCVQGTCAFPEPSDADFVEDKEDENTEADHAPVAQVRCCADAKPLAGNQPSKKDFYWGGANVLTRDNKIQFAEMVVYALGGKKGLSYRSKKAFMQMAAIIKRNPNWKPHYKGYKMTRNFMPIGGHLKQMKHTKPGNCEQQCTNGAIGLCEGFVVLRDVCWLKTSATTGIATGAQAIGTYYFAKKMDEMMTGFDRVMGANKIPVSIKYLQKNLVLSSKNCALRCKKPRRGVCRGFLIDKRGICHLVSSFSKAGVRRNGYNFFKQLHTRRGPAVSGFKRHNHQSGGRTLAKLGRMSVNRCAKMCNKPAAGLCTAFEITSTGKCVLKGVGPLNTRRSRSRLYTKKQFRSELNVLTYGNYRISKNSFVGRTFFRGKITAKNCRKFCDDVPVFIGAKKVRGSRALACKGFEISADGTCKMFSKIRGQRRSATSYAFRNKHNGMRVFKEWNYRAHARHVCPKFRRAFIRNSQNNVDQARKYYSQARKACSKLHRRNKAIAHKARHICSQVRAKFVRNARKLSERHINNLYNTARQACSKMNIAKVAKEVSRLSRHVCVDEKGNFVKSARRKGSVGAVHKLYHYFRRKCGQNANKRKRDKANARRNAARHAAVLKRNAINRARAAGERIKRAARAAANRRIRNAKASARRRYGRRRFPTYRRPRPRRRYRRRPRPRRRYRRPRRRRRRRFG